jgi:serine/threonine protein kinase
MDTLTGKRLGKYQIETLIGRGGMASVYRAHDTALNRSVAIKVLDPALSVDANAVERFRREAVTSANLEHPSIVRVYDVEQSGNLYYMAMRFVQGTTLREILRDNGALPLDVVVNIVKPISAALHYAHQHGVIHRDVKPGNILVEPDGTVLLTDFGIARAADNTQSSLTAHGHVMGTADYLAPEQISGRPATTASDVYSLGVVLYEMLTGVTPFAGENTASVLYRQVHDKPSPLRSINPRIPSELQPILDRALAKNPALRYADPLDLARDLEETVQWLPEGSPWLGRKGPQGTNGVSGSRNGSGSAPGAAAAASNGAAALSPTGVLSNGGSAAAVSQGAKGNARKGAPGTGPVVAPPPTRAYTPDVPASRHDVIAPPVDRSRLTTLAIALVLLLAGAVLLIAASGVLSGARGSSGPRFQPPGPSQYSGPLRKDNGPDIHIPQALVPPTIDGDLSDWQGATPGPFPAPYLTYQKGRTLSGPDDLSASFNFAWDKDNFYVAATITDNIHIQNINTRGYDLYYGDDIEIWFDTDLPGDFNAGEGNADDFQMGLSPGDFAGLAPEAVFWKPDRNDSRNKLVKVGARPRVGAHGYTLEAAVPWTVFGTFRPQPGGAIGFAASAGDSDRAVNPYQELMVSTAPTLQWNDPLTFGNLFF